MDREHLSATSIQELGEQFMDALQQAGPELLGADLEEHPKGTRRRLQRRLRPVLGRVVETVLATIAATQVTVQPICPIRRGGLGRWIGQAGKEGLAVLACPECQ